MLSVLRSLMLACLLLACGCSSPKPTARPPKAKTPQQVRSTTPLPTSNAAATPITRAKTQPIEAITVTAESAPLFTVPNSMALSFNKARKGDSFEFRGEQDGFFEILMFSGEYRYIRKSDASRGNVSVLLPVEESERRAIYDELLQAESEATSMVEGMGVADMEQMIATEREMTDSLKLDLYHRHKANPIIDNEIVLEGTEKRWGFMH